LSLPFSYDLPVILKLNFSQPALVGGSLTIIGNNFRSSTVPVAVAVGATSCSDISLVHPHTTFKCMMTPFFNGPSRVNVSVIFDTTVAYVWRGFSFGDVRGILTPTPLDFQKSLSGAYVIHPFISQSLGMRSISLLASIHSSSCTFSSWLSDTSLSCKQSSGLFPRTNSSLRVSVASSGIQRYQATFFIQNPSCQFLQLFQARNGSFGSTTGSSYLSFLSGSLGTSDKSVKSRVGATSCDSSVWVSDSEVAAKTFPSRKSSTIVVLSVSNFVTLCPEALNISLKPDAGNVSTLHSAISGPIFVLVDGINMGHKNACSKLRLASSASSVTSWTSDSSMVGKMSTRIAASHVPSVLLSISKSISNFNSTMAQAFLSSHGGFYVSSHSLLNFPASGTLFLSLILSSVGTIDASSRISRGFSACLASLWKSESSIICKSGSEILPANSVTMSIQTSKFDLKISVSVPLAITNPNTSKHFEVASSGSGMIALQCQNLGAWSFSRNVRIHQSACQFSSWISESNIICKPHLASSSFGAIVISSDGKMPSGYATNSWRFYISGNATNTPFTGSSKLTMFGVGLLSHDLSARVRLSGTACDFTNWRSFTNINAKVPRGKGLFSITISLQIYRHEDSIYKSVFDFEDFSFVPFSYMHTVYPSTGGIEMNLIGKSASNEDKSGSVRLR
jgi:hypothetical protein